MDEEKILNFYEKIYFREIDEMNLILSRYPVLLAGVALIFNAYLAILKFDKFQGLPSVISITMSTIAFIASIALLYSLLKTILVRRYKVAANLFELENFREALVRDEALIKERNKAYPQNYQKERAWEDEFESYLKDTFIDCSKINTERNNDRRKWFHRSMMLIWINLFLCITIPFVSFVISQGDSFVRQETTSATNSTNTTPSLSGFREWWKGQVKA